MYLWFCRFEESAFINSICPSGIVSGGGITIQNVCVCCFLAHRNESVCIKSWMHSRFYLFQLEADLFLLYGFIGRINLKSFIAILYS